MYQSHSTAHRIAHDLLVHPDTIRLGGNAMYDAEDGENPAEATIEFGNGTGMTIFDRDGGAVKVQTYTRKGLLGVDTIAPDPHLGAVAQYRGLLDTVAQRAAHAYRA